MGIITRNELLYKETSMSALGVVFFLIVITMGHELAHTLVGLALGYKLKIICLGFPLKIKLWGKEYSAVIYSRKFGNTEVAISWLIMGGAVDFYDFDDPPFWKMALIALAGPVSNFLFAYIALALVFGPVTAYGEMSFQINSLLTGIGLLGTGHIPVSSMTGVVGMVNEFATLSRQYYHGRLLVWTLINNGLAVTNLFPIPALDGGQILMAGIPALLGERFKKPAKNVTYAFLYALMAIMVIVMFKDVL